MHDDLRQAAAAHGGYLAASDLRRLGWSSRAVTALVRARVLTRIRHGAYALADDWSRLSDVDRHVVLARAVVGRLGGRVALCGLSSLLVRGADVWDVDLGSVDVVRIDAGTGRREAGVRHHVARIDPVVLEEHSGLLLVPAATATWQVMCTTDVERGLVVGDSVLAKGFATIDEIDQAATDGAHHRGALRAGITRRLLDGRAANPAETRSRFLCWEFRLPRPELQVPIVDRGGVVLGIADMVWDEYAHVAEFDGRVKYSGVLVPGQEPAEAVWAEKLREDAIRAAGWGVSRLVWSQLASAQRASTAARLLSDMRASQRHFLPLRQRRPA